MTRRFTLVMLLFSALVTFGAGMPFAWADDKTVVGNAHNLDPQDIDPYQHSSLVLYKGVPKGQGSGTGVSDTHPIAGAKFTIKRIEGIELNTPEGWETAKRLKVNEVKNAQSDFIDSAETNSEGKAIFPALPVGVYLVAENRIGDTRHGKHRVAPFLVTLPIGHVTGDYWQYDVEISVKTKQVHTGVGGPFAEDPDGWFPDDDDEGEGGGNNGGGEGDGRGGGEGDGARADQTGANVAHPATEKLSAEAMEAFMSGRNIGAAKNLAETGSSVDVVLAFGALWLAGGLLLVRRSRAS